MKISHNWLLQFINTQAQPEIISSTLTDIGLEVEGLESKGSVPENLEGVVVAEVQNVNIHPNADRLKICQVFDGKETLQIVCGAPNVKENQKVALAKIGTTLHFTNGDVVKIKKGKIRGEVSEGMLCAEDELGISNKHDGIMVLNEMAPLGTPLKQWLQANSDTDWVYEIGLTPNRTDAMSHYGVARDLNAGLSYKNIESELNSIKQEFKFNNTKQPSFKVELENKDCKRYCLAYLTDVKIEPSPNWLQQKLKHIGLEPINNVVDITNYVLHSYGQPLHAFDAEKISNKTIRVGNCAEGTTFTTLDKSERKLNSEDLMIKDGENTPLCIAGVFGGLDSGVSENTTSIALESAYFDPVAVRKTAKRHGLNTDASFRFERGVDPNITLIALQKATELLLDIAGAKIEEEFIDINTFQKYHSDVFLNYKTLKSISGAEISKEDIQKILHLLEIEVVSTTDLGLELKIPSYRVDVTREIDVIEEILRIYGFNNIQASQKFQFSLSEDSSKNYTYQQIVAQLLSNNGYFEVINNSLTNSENKEIEVKLLNPLSADLAVMRTSMLPGLLQNLQYNINRNQDNIKLFEFGKTYEKQDSKYIEKQKFALAISGEFTSENWFLPQKPTSFFHLKGILEEVFSKLGIDVKDSISENEYLEETLSLKKGNAVLAELGKVNSSTLKKYGLNQEVFYAEIHWDLVEKHFPESSFKLKPIPKFPGSRRDLALLLDKEVMYQDLKDTAFEVNNKLLKEVNLFDVYEGKNLPEGKKSYALSYNFLDEEKTITDAQIEEIINKILKNYEKQYNASLRT